jgi:hypothetical protein
MPILVQSSTYWSHPRDFVRISASWLLVLTCSSVNLPSSTHCLMKWYLVSMCLLRSWKTGFLLSCITDLLSIFRVNGLASSSPLNSARSLSKPDFLTHCCGGHNVFCFTTWQGHHSLLFGLPCDRIAIQEEHDSCGALACVHVPSQITIAIANQLTSSFLPSIVTPKINCPCNVP